MTPLPSTDPLGFFKLCVLLIFTRVVNGFSSAKIFLLAPVRLGLFVDAKELHVFQSWPSGLPVLPPSLLFCFFFVRHGHWLISCLLKAQVIS